MLWQSVTMLLLRCGMLLCCARPGLWRVAVKGRVQMGWLPLIGFSWKRLWCILSCLMTAVSFCGVRRVSCDVWLVGLQRTIPWKRHTMIVHMKNQCPSINRMRCHCPNWLHQKQLPPGLSQPCLHHHCGLDLTSAKVAAAAQLHGYSSSCQLVHG